MPLTGPRSTSSALMTSSLYQAEKSSLCGVTPCSSRATGRDYGIEPAANRRNNTITGLGGKQVLIEDPSGNPVELFEPILPEAKLPQPS